MTVKQPERGFPDSEYQTRLGTAQRKMAAEGIDGLFLTTEPEFRYFSGFHSLFWQSPTRPWFLIVPEEGKPVAVIPGIGKVCMEKTWIDDIRTWSSPNPDDEGISILADTITELLGKSATIGLLEGPESHLRMPLADFARLKSNLPCVEFKDCNDLVRAQRVIKSEREIEKIRFAAQAASRAFSRTPDIIKRGISVRQMFQAFKHVLLDEGIDDVSYLVGGARNSGYNDIISQPTERLLEKGDVVILDTGSIWDGYFCDFDRNFSIGKPTDEVASAHHIIWDATEAAIEIAKPGTTCAELFYCMNKAMGGASGNVGRLGHGLGMQLTEHPSHAAFDQTVLQEGMVLTLEPGFDFAPGREMVHEENLVIRENGCELLSKRASRDIPVIEGF